MIGDELIHRIQQHFGFIPTPEQKEAISIFSQFITDRDMHTLMILRGSAGTGKTVLSGAIVKAMNAMKQKVILLAPTGRAAKVFSLNSNGHPAFTIHRKIYRQRTFEETGGIFNINDNLHTDTLFLIDEASMVANAQIGDTAFGSGRLLDDLVRYVYQGRNCRMMLIGDKAQLPPVGESESPALLSDVMQGYALKV